MGAAVDARAATLHDAFGRRQFDDARGLGGGVGAGGVGDAGRIPHSEDASEWRVVGPVAPPLLALSQESATGRVTQRPIPAGQARSRVWRAAGIDLLSRFRYTTAGAKLDLGWGLDVELH